MTHRNSTGATQPIRPGEVNWMTAGKGVTHSERFETLRAHGGPWTASRPGSPCPWRRAKRTTPPIVLAPRGVGSLPGLEEADGVSARLIAGEGLRRALARPDLLAPGLRPLRTMSAGARGEVPADYAERAVYVARGSVEIDGQAFGYGKMILLTRRSGRDGDGPGGRPSSWSSAASRSARAADRVELRRLHPRERMEQAKADWRAGRMKLHPTADNQEFIPLPEPPPAKPMS